MDNVQDGSVEALQTFDRRVSWFECRAQGTRLPHPREPLRSARKHQPWHRNRCRGMQSSHSPSIKTLDIQKYASPFNIDSQSISFYKLHVTQHFHCIECVLLHQILSLPCKTSVKSTSLDDLHTYIHIPFKLTCRPVGVDDVGTGGADNVCRG